MKSISRLFILLIVLSSVAFSQRIKDIATISGDNAEQVIGYGLVVGLAGTGDSYRTQFTMQSITSMLKRFGITVPQTDVKTRNVAAVMVTANLSSNYKPGAKSVSYTHLRAHETVLDLVCRLLLEKKKQKKIHKKKNHYT